MRTMSGTVLAGWLELAKKKNQTLFPRITPKKKTSEYKMIFQNRISHCVCSFLTLFTLLSLEGRSTRSRERIIWSFLCFPKATTDTPCSKGQMRQIVRSKWLPKLPLFSISFPKRSLSAPRGPRRLRNRFLIAVTHASSSQPSTYTDRPMRWKREHLV